MDENNQKYIGNLVHDGFYEELVIIGFPYDQGVKNHNLTVGSFLGPDSMRRFLKNCPIGVLKNVEYGIDIEQWLPKISDYGNVQTEDIKFGQQPMSLQ